MITGILLALLLAEILVRIFIPRYKMTTWIEMHPRGFMMNQSGVEAFHEFRDRRITYHLNEQGLRGEELTSSDDKRVLLLGDSYTFGLLLHQEDTFADLLQLKADQHFEKQSIRILNGGVGGAGLADWPAWLEVKGPEIEPDKVILFLNTSDIDRAISKNLFVIDEADSTLVNSMYWKPNEFMFRLGRQGWYQWIQRHSILANILVTMAWEHLYFTDITNNFDPETSEVPVPAAKDLYPESDYSVRLADKLVLRMNEWCEKNNCDFILATTGFFDPDKMGDHTANFYHFITENFPHDIRFFDNTPCIYEKSDGNYEPLLIPGDGHPNEQGASLVAECSWQWLLPLLNPESSD